MLKTTRVSTVLAILSSIAFLSISCGNPLSTHRLGGKGSMKISIRVPAIPRGSDGTSSRLLTANTVSIHAQLLRSGTALFEDEAANDGSGLFTLNFVDIP